MIQRRRALSFVIIGCLVLATASPTRAAESGKEKAPPARGAAVAGGALPGGAIISAAFVSVLPVTGGDVVCVPLAADGSFKLDGLAAGRYRLAVTSQPVTKQTQGAIFGEKVNAGLHAAGSALASGAQRSGDMPNRISMNVTVPKQTHRVEVNGATVEVDIATDGKLAGRAAVIATEAPAPAAGTN